MSINSTMKPYLLQVVTTQKDELNCDVQHFEDVCYINVSVNDKFATAVSNGVIYKQVLVSGITRWVDFDKNKKYVLKRCDIARLDGKHVLDGTLKLDGYIVYDKQYEIDDFVACRRFSQLALKEVIIDGQ